MKNIYLCACSFLFLPILCAAKPEKSGCLEKEQALTLLETAQDLLSKAEISFPSCNNDSDSTDPPECSGKKPLTYIQFSKKLITDLRDNFPTCTGLPDIKVIVPSVKYKDCAAVLASGHNASGVYTLWISESNSTGRPVQVYCDMKTDRGGWTVVQRRGKFKVQQDFYQDWETYKKGFGNISEEFWLGNENIRNLCLNGCEIRFDIEDSDGRKGFANYKHFQLSGNNFTISISNCTGDIKDAMQHHNNWPFSTKDKDYFERANKLQGGWWYSNNIYAALNGKYQPGKTGYDGIVWWSWQKSDMCMASVEMKVRPKINKTHVM